MENEYIWIVGAFVEMTLPQSIFLSVVFFSLTFLFAFMHILERINENGK